MELNKVFNGWNKVTMKQITVIHYELMLNNMCINVSYLNSLVNALSLSKAFPRYFKTLSPARKNSLVPPRIDSVSGKSLITYTEDANIFL